MPRTLLRWAGAIIVSIVCVGFLNFTWVQGAASFLQETPHPPNDAIVARYFAAIFFLFDSLIFLLLFLYFRDAKKNLKDFALTCILLNIVLYIGVAILSGHPPVVGFGYPHFSIRLIPLF